MNLLKVKNLEVRFLSEKKYTIAVKGINFELNAGETVGIVGESGSGKSVTSLSIMRLLSEPPAKIDGEIIFNQLVGKSVSPLNQTQDEQTEPDNSNHLSADLIKLDDRAMCGIRGKEIAMIFQEPMTSLNPVFTCGHQVMEAIMVHNQVSHSEAKTQTLALFEKVKLPDKERIFSSYPHQLSGGQKQRVMIAMALSCNPKILIADEPTTALDVTVQKSILELLKSLQAEYGMTIVFITHDLGVIAEIADRVLVMYKGSIVEENTVENIFLNPQHPYTRSLLACRPPLDVRLSRLPVVADFMDVSVDINGNVEITEKPHSVIVLKKSYLIPDEQTKQRLAFLQSQKPILEVCNLKVYYPNKRNFFGVPQSFTKAVDDVSFEVFPGETLGLVGESGCGKTTLGRAILGLIPVNSGEIIYKGEDLLELSHSGSPEKLKALRKDIQIVFQDPYSSLNPRMTIGSAIMEPMQVHKLYTNDTNRLEKVRELLEIVGLDNNHFNRYPHEFSGGQRQRICIARALSLNPSFIICDESVSALDVSVQAQVLNLLMSLREKFGFTCIFISHDLSVVKFISDRMVVMNKGKIEESGNADDVYYNPKSDYTGKLIEAIPRMER